MPTNATERRYIQADELRFDESASRISGYAAVFNSMSEDLGGFREIIVPGAFTRALDGSNVPLLIEHDGLPLADVRTGSLTLSQDERGLSIAADLDASDPDVQRVLPKLKRGTLRSMSFGFTIARGGDRWDRKEDGVTRSIVQVKRLFDVSIVTTPAYPDTSVALRSLESWDEEHKELPPILPFQRELRRRRLQIAGF